MQTILMGTLACFHRKLCIDSIRVPLMLFIVAINHVSPRNKHARTHLPWARPPCTTYMLIWYTSNEMTPGSVLNSKDDSATAAKNVSPRETNRAKIALNRCGKEYMSGWKNKEAATGIKWEQVKSQIVGMNHTVLASGCEGEKQLPSSATKQPEEMANKCIHIALPHSFSLSFYFVPIAFFQYIDLYSPIQSLSSSMGKNQSKLSVESLSELQKTTHCKPVMPCHAMPWLLLLLDLFSFSYVTSWQKRDPTMVQSLSSIRSSMSFPFFLSHPTLSR